MGGQFPRNLNSFCIPLELHCTTIFLAEYMRGHLAEIGRAPASPILFQEIPFGPGKKIRETFGTLLRYR